MLDTVTDKHNTSSKSINLRKYSDVHHHHKLPNYTTKFPKALPPELSLFDRVGEHLKGKYSNFVRCSTFRWRVSMN